MKEHIKIDASVASHKGNVHSKNEEKFYLNGQYMDLNQQKDSTSKSATHSYKQSVYGVASGTVRGTRGEKAAFIAIEALSRYHLYLEENGLTSFAVKKQRLIEHLESAKEKIKELSEDEDIEDLGATMVGLIIDGNRAFGFSLGEEGFYMVEKDSVRRVPMDNVKTYYHIGSDKPIEKILRVTDEFVLDKGDRMLLTSEDTYLHAMEGKLLSLIKNLSTKESTKAYIREMLTREGQKNLTALLIYVEVLEGYAVKNSEKFFAHSMNSSRGIDKPEETEKAQEEEQSSEQGKSQQEKSEEKIDRKEDPERERIFEQRYAESRMLFNKKLQPKDFEFSPIDESLDEGEETLGTEDSLLKKSEEDFYEEKGEEFYEEREEDEESPWRTRSKFLLIALFAVGVIVMAFALGSIRDLEQRDFNSSAENVDEEETGEGNEEEPLEEENSDGEEADEELAIDNDENVSEEAPSDGEDVEDIEDPETDPGAPIEDESAGGETTESVEEEETYEIQSGDTLFSISRAFYGDGSMVDEIIRLNNIEDINNIQVGDILRLPSRD